MPRPARTDYVFRRVAFTCVLACLPQAHAMAESPAYTMVEVKDQVLLELPNDWTVVDGERRPRVAEPAKKSGLPLISVSALSATSDPADSRAAVRVTFLKLDPPVTQEQALASAERDVKATADNWKAMEGKMWADLGKMGIKQVGQPSFAAETLSGQLAIVIRYQRTHGTNSAKPAQLVNVTQNHVVLGAERALITFSYDDGDKRALAEIERIKNSLVIK